MLDSSDNLSLEDKFTILYHSLFSFPLKVKEVKKWQPGKLLKFRFKKEPQIVFQDGFYFLEGEEKQVKIRLKRERCSIKKIKMAKKAVEVLKFLPFLKFIGITGSLAMKNSEPDSDIDFLIITKKGTLWTSRLFCFFLFKVKGIPFRRFSKEEKKDKLCLNMWLDEGDLVWNKHNLFSAHEIAQIIPLLNRDMTYERFVFENLWFFDFWPNSLVFKDIVSSLRLDISCQERFLNRVFYFLVVLLVEPFAYLAQKIYMRKKITKELVLKNRAIFHPVDFNLVVFRKLKKMGVEIL